MSSTNHTTNYNLPQYVGSDKPAWLGDINPAFNAIDTAMHNNAVAAETAGTDATAAKNNIGTMANLETTEKSTLVGAVNEVNTKAGTAQTTANQAVGDAAAVDTKLTTFMKKFNLTSFTNITSISATGGTQSGKITLAQNSDGSIFKLYGHLEITGQSSIAGTVAVPGLSGYYGIATGLYLTTAPDEAYAVDAGGTLYRQNMNTYAADQFNSLSFAVGTDGQIYIWLLNWNMNTYNVPSGYALEFNYPACLYFNASFGDTPVTPGQ